MPTDDDRREVAAKLREDTRRYLLEGRFCNPEMGHRLAKAIGCRYFGAGPQISDLFPRLADLIEPSCDREALLEEAKELEKCAWYFGLDFDADEPLRDRLKEASEDFAGCARRIREALGVTDG